MRLLIDTHVLLALIERGARSLPEGVAGLLGDQESEHHLSAASLWEIAIKSRLGKLRLTVGLGALPELLAGLGVKIVAIDERHALTEVEPEPTTRDPFDRMLLAQCQVEGLKLITIDRALVSHPLAAKGQARGVARRRAAGRLAKSAH
jgi:PIN domain nuclease of toxin-antitoxin system